MMSSDDDNDDKPNLKHHEELFLEELKAIPNAEKTGYLLALEKCPELLVLESPMERFTSLSSLSSVEDDDDQEQQSGGGGSAFTIDRIVSKFVQYWEKRVVVYGNEKAFLHLHPHHDNDHMEEQTQKKQGAEGSNSSNRGEWVLKPASLTLLRSMWISLLPCDSYGRPVLFLNLSWQTDKNEGSQDAADDAAAKDDDNDITIHQQRLQCVFYILQALVMMNELDTATKLQARGCVLLILYDKEFKKAESILAELDDMLLAFPIRLAEIHIVVSNATVTCEDDDEIDFTTAAAGTTSATISVCSQGGRGGTGGNIGGSSSIDGVNNKFYDKFVPMAFKTMLTSNEKQHAHLLENFCHVHYLQDTHTASSLSTLAATLATFGISQDILPSVLGGRWTRDKHNTWIDARQYQQQNEQDNGGRKTNVNSKATLELARNRAIAIMPKESDTIRGPYTAAEKKKMLETQHSRKKRDRWNCRHASFKLALDFKEQEKKQRIDEQRRLIDFLKRARKLAGLKADDFDDVVLHAPPPAAPVQERASKRTRRTEKTASVSESGTSVSAPAARAPASLVQYGSGGGGLASDTALFSASASSFLYPQAARAIQPAPALSFHPYTMQQPPPFGNMYLSQHMTQQEQWPLPVQSAPSFLVYDSTSLGSMYNTGSFLRGSRFGAPVSFLTLPTANPSPSSSYFSAMSQPPFSTSAYLSPPLQATSAYHHHQTAAGPSLNSTLINASLLNLPPMPAGQQEARYFYVLPQQQQSTAPSTLLDSSRISGGRGAPAPPYPPP